MPPRAAGGWRTPTLIQLLGHFFQVKKKTKQKHAIQKNRFNLDSAEGHTHIVKQTLVFEDVSVPLCGHSWAGSCRRTRINNPLVITELHVAEQLLVIIFWLLSASLLFPERKKKINLGGENKWVVFLLSTKVWIWAIKKADYLLSLGNTWGADGITCYLSHRTRLLLMCAGNFNKDESFKDENCRVGSNMLSSNLYVN